MSRYLMADGLLARPQLPLARQAMAETVAARRDRVPGIGYIAGTAPGLVTVDGTPAQRDVVLIDRISCWIVARALSAPDGSYRFDHLAMDGRYTVYAWDRFGDKNAVIRDLITPTLMPEYAPP